ncbi:MAG TPA: TetR/AcrR family transcriptional regulator [Bryobacteraceae bacterium]|jgi:AcrR family transcriptional regulator
MTVVHPTKKEVVSEFRRAGILKAARKVFARHGFDGATMDDVAEACNIAKGTLYLYFKSKRQIYGGVLREDLQSLREATGRAIEAAATAEGKIRAFISARFDFFEQHRDFFRIYNSDISAIFVSAHPMQKDLRDFYLEQAEMLAGILADGIQAGEIRNVPPQAAAFAIYDMTRACIARRILGLSPQDGDTDMAILLDFIRKGIGHV